MTGKVVDHLQLIHDARKHGARVALFGRKINLSESPLDFIRFLRHVVDDEITPAEAVKAYHSALASRCIAPLRPPQQDLQVSPQTRCDR